MRDLSRRSVYLLTVWEERPAVWRFSLEDARTGQRWGFENLERLLDFLQARMGAEKQRNEGTKEEGHP